MKTLKSLFVCALFTLVTFQISQARNPIPENAVAPSQILQKTLSGIIKYPEEARRFGIEATVLLIFTIDENNQVQVLNSISKDNAMARYAKSKIDGKTVEGDSIIKNTIYSTTLEFKLI